MAKYKLREASIYEYECFQLPTKGDFDTDPFFEWAQKNQFENWWSARDETMDIQSHSGELMCANPEDWIVLNSDGDPSVYDPEEFENIFIKK